MFWYAGNALRAAKSERAILSACAMARGVLDFIIPFPLDVLEGHKEVHLICRGTQVTCSGHLIAAEPFHDFLARTARAARVLKVKNGLKGKAVDKVKAIDNASPSVLGADDKLDLMMRSALLRQAARYPDRTVSQMLKPDGSRNTVSKNDSKRVLNAIRAEWRALVDAIAEEPDLKTPPFSYLESTFGCTPMEGHLVYLMTRLDPFMQSLAFNYMMDINTDEATRTPHVVLAGLLGAQASEVLTMLESGALRRAGCLETHQGSNSVLSYSALNQNSFLTLSAALRAALTSELVKDEEDFCARMRGRKMAHSDVLEWKDFAHIGQLAEVAVGLLKAKTVRGGILLVGPPGAGKTEFTRALAERAGRSLYSVAESRDGEEPTRSQRFAALKTSALLNDGAVLLLDEAEDVLCAPSGATDRYAFSKAHLNRFLEDSLVPVIWTVNSLRNIDIATVRRMALVITFERPGSAVRKRIWDRILAHIPIPGAKAEVLARDWDMSAGVCETAARTVHKSGAGASALPLVLGSFAQVFGSGRARREDDVPEFDPAFCEADMDPEAMAAKLASSGRLDWSMCLYGPPGAGKSAFARHVATRLNMRWSIKRASDLLDKYVGGSEKLIAEAFAEAKRDRVCLIIDEADSMLGSREAATQSWQITQVNEMLTQMETHDLPFFATTNLMDKIDKASLRRFTFSVGFRDLPPRKVKAAFRGILGFDFPEGIVVPDNVSAGDIAALRKKAAVLDITDPKVLAEWLREASDLKVGGRKNPLGFN